MEDQVLTCYILNFSKTERSKEIVLRSQKSRLQEFKQISVETFIMLKQKLNESRKVTLEKVKNGMLPETYRL